MINIISNWAGELVVTLVVVTLIEMLLPNNKIKKYVKTIIGLYIVFCIISPFVNKEKFATILEKVEEEIKKDQIEKQLAREIESSDKSIESLYIQEFEKDISKQVEKFGYKVKKCEVDIKIEAAKENAEVNSINLKIGDKLDNQNSTNVQIENIEKVEISIGDKKNGDTSNVEETEDTRKVKEFLSDYYKISEQKIKIVQE